MIPGVRLKLCTAEDLIVFKAFANPGIIAGQTKAKIDWNYIYSQLTPLVALKEEPEILPKLKALVEECES